MRREYSNFVAAVLEPNSGIDDQTFGPANTEVWMEEDNVLLLRVGHGGLCSNAGAYVLRAHVDIWKSR